MTDFNDLDKCASDITYVRLRCDLYGSRVDNSITSTPELLFIFYHKLPQYEYDPTTKKAVIINIHATLPSVRTSGGTARYLLTSFQLPVCQLQLINQMQVEVLYLDPVLQASLSHLLS